jgi:hypothetical protein
LGAVEKRIGTSTVQFGAEKYRVIEEEVTTRFNSDLKD